jgi:DNA-binding response OmpR family regulator
VDEEVRVLLIEDDEAAAEMYRLRLANDGYTVLHASDGESGVARALQEQPDLIYLDVRLPKLDGFQVLEQLRANPQTSAIPVVMLTNYGEPELRERGLELGALEFLVKADTTPAFLSGSVGQWAGAAPVEDEAAAL